MKEMVTKGIICLNDELDFVYHIAEIEYHEWEDETFSYIFRPNYSVIDLLSRHLFQGIPGLNLELRKPEYVRKNMTPVFISERTPGENREDLWELLGQVGMDYLNRLEWLIRTDMRYSGDLLYVIRSEKEERVIDFELLEGEENRSVKMMKRLLQYICLGKNITSPNIRIDNQTRKGYYNLLMSLYKKEKGYIERQRQAGRERAKEQGKYRGRKEISIDGVLLNEICESYCKGRIREAEAVRRLGVTRATFYRRLRKYREEQEDKDERQVENEMESIKNGDCRA